mmetsp:Transcript_55189/g.118612  ORF Transcript_55189/g.118612 Transcript_55189/m.118612 type:complete len:444 (-) Transcript_55189:110-1441(-)
MAGLGAAPLGEAPQAAPRGPKKREPFHKGEAVQFSDVAKFVGTSFLQSSASQPILPRRQDVDVSLPPILNQEERRPRGVEVVQGHGGNQERRRPPGKSNSEATLGGGVARGLGDDQAGRGPPAMTGPLADGSALTASQDDATSASKGVEAANAWEMRSPVKRRNFISAAALRHKEEGGDISDVRRQVIREELIKQAGSARAAFKKLDANNSGRVSTQDFASGVSCMGLKWGELTGLRTERDFFRLFDLNRDGAVDFAEIFPEELQKESEPRNISTPEFVSKWSRMNRSHAVDGERNARWIPTSHEEELSLLFGSLRSREKAADERSRMSATIRRLKSRGKSDARCRELVASHLPRGTGPRDRDDVNTFSIAEVTGCKKTYNEEVSNRQRSIQKAVQDMREQRRALADARQKLSKVTRAADADQATIQVASTLASAFSDKAPFG